VPAGLGAHRQVEGTLSTPTATGHEATSTGLELHFAISFDVEGAASRSGGSSPSSNNAGKLQLYPAQCVVDPGGKTLRASGAELAALCGGRGSGLGIVIDNAPSAAAQSASTCSNIAGMRIGFSLRDIATARANVAAVDHLSFDEVQAAAWRQWNTDMSRIAVMDDPSTPAMQRELGLFYSVLYHSMKNPKDFTGQVPSSWTVDGKADSGYVFDLGTMSVLATLPRLCRRRRRRRCCCCCLAGLNPRLPSHSHRSVRWLPACLHACCVAPAVPTRAAPPHPLSHSALAACGVACGRWDQYKYLLPLLVSVWPDTIGRHLAEGLCALSKRFGEFPTGYTMDTDTTRFDGQAIGLAHHTLADAYFRNVELGIHWGKDVVPLMARTFDRGEGQSFVRQGRSPSATISRTLDLCGAALATGLVAQGSGDVAAAAAMLPLTDNFVNVYDGATGLLSNTKADKYLVLYPCGHTCIVHSCSLQWAPSHSGLLLTRLLTLR
jgi:hypothetical protein